MTNIIYKYETNTIEENLDKDFSILEQLVKNARKADRNTKKNA